MIEAFKYMIFMAGFAAFFIVMSWAFKKLGFLRTKLEAAAVWIVVAVLIIAFAMLWGIPFSIDEPHYRR